MQQHNKAPDLLDDTVAFLAKREGIDKTLKVLRYATRLLLATALRGDGELAKRLGHFESSIGTSRWGLGHLPGTLAAASASAALFMPPPTLSASAAPAALPPRSTRCCRKAYRLGKFCTQINTMRKTPPNAPCELGVGPPHLPAHLLALPAACQHCLGASQPVWIRSPGCCWDGVGSKRRTAYHTLTCPPRGGGPTLAACLCSRGAGVAGGGRRVRLLLCGAAAVVSECGEIEITACGGAVRRAGLSGGGSKP